MENYKLAIDDYSKAITLNPNNTDAIKGKIEAEIALKLEIEIIASLDKEFEEEKKKWKFIHTDDDDYIDDDDKTRMKEASEDYYGYFNDWEEYTRD